MVTYGEGAADLVAVHDWRLFAMLLGPKAAVLYTVKFVELERKLNEVVVADVVAVVVV